MYLYQSTNVIYLFKDITSSWTDAYVGLVFLSFFLALLLEYLGYLHFIVKNKPNQESKILHRLLTIGSYTCQITLGFLVMLVYMTYNFCIMLAVMLGLTIGYSYFGIRKLNMKSKNKEMTYEVVHDKCCA